MKDVDSGLEHGVVRVVKVGEWVSERTYRNGRMHGLNRHVSEGKVRVMLYKDGDELAFFEFGQDLVEGVRGGSAAHLLGFIKPEMFMKLE